MKREPELDAIYHEPLGWIGAKGGLRIKTISFARQLAEL